MSNWIRNIKEYIMKQIYPLRKHLYNFDNTSLVNITDEVLYYKTVDHIITESYKFDTAQRQKSPIKFLGSYNEGDHEYEKIITDNWLNDDIINDFFTRLKLNSENREYFYCDSYITAESEFKFITSFYREGKNWFDSDVKKIFIPLNIKDGSHWILIVINYDNSKAIANIEIFDSLVSSRESYLKYINYVFTFLQVVYMWFIHTELPCVDKFKLIIHNNIPQQSDAYNCGVFVCRYCYDITNNIPILNENYTPRKITEFRRYLIPYITETDILSRNVIKENTKSKRTFNYNNYRVGDIVWHTGLENFVKINEILKDKGSFVVSDINNSSFVIETTEQHLYRDKIDVIDIEENIVVQRKRKKRDNDEEYKIIEESKGGGEEERKMDIMDIMDIELIPEKEEVIRPIPSSSKTNLGKRKSEQIIDVIDIINVEGEAVKKKKIESILDRILSYKSEDILFIHYIEQYNKNKKTIEFYIMNGLELNDNLVNSLKSTLIKALAFIDKDASGNQVIIKQLEDEINNLYLTKKDGSKQVRKSKNVTKRVSPKLMKLMKAISISKKRVKKS